MAQLPLFLMLVALAPPDRTRGDLARQGPVVKELHDSIVRNGYRRVGVLPRFLVREGGREVLGGSLGPEADYMAERLEEALLTAAGGKYRMVDSRQMREAVKTLTIDDLGKRDALARVASAVGGLDALVVGMVTDLRAQPTARDRPPLDIQARLIDLKDSSVAAVSKDTGGISLSDAAYMGESWELRRWSGAQLQIVGLSPPQEGAASKAVNPLYGTGAGWELLQYPLIRRDRPHPLLDSSCAYRLAVVVDGQERPLQRIGAKVYVALDPGETYWIRVENRLARPVYMSVFVDGINILGKRREHPAKSAYWHLNPSYTSNLKGWYTGKGPDYKVEEFVIAPADNTVAAGQGFGQQLGMITAVFFTVGTEGIPKTRGLLFSAMPGEFGTGAGRTSSIRLGQVAGPEPGLMLAATTIYYAVSPRLEELRREAAQ